MGVQTASAPVKVSDEEGVVWYDSDAHTLFDVCADDHCQRYQGITKATSPHVEEAIKATRGQLLMNGKESAMLVLVSVVEVFRRNMSTVGIILISHTCSL